MNSSNGTFIVLEGVDERLINEQLSLLADVLSKEGYDVLLLSSSTHNQSSPYIEHLQTGKYGNVLEVNPYIATLLYGLHRFDNKQQIENALRKDCVVLGSGYTVRQLITQGQRLTSTEERHSFYMWVDTMEYQLMSLPRPTLNLLLVTDLPKKQKTILEAYHDITRTFPKDFRLIDCMRKKRILPSDHIYKLLYEQIVPYLHAPKAEKGTVTYSLHQTDSQPIVSQYIDLQSQQASESSEEKIVSRLAFTEFLQHDILSEPLSYNENFSYYTPRSLPNELQDEYTQFYKQSKSLYKKLHKHLSPSKSQYLAQMVLPLGVQQALHISHTVLNSLHSPLLELQELGSQAASKKQLDMPKLHAKPATYTDDHTEIRLLSSLPHNEMDTLLGNLYPLSGLSTEELTHESTSWQYEEKVQLLQASLKQPKTTALYRYSWELIAPMYILLDVSGYIKNASWSFQKLTPRFGYDIPEHIETIGLSEEVEQCFDESFQLYNKLLTVSEDEAGYTLLNGHKSRVTITLTARDIVETYQEKNIPLYLKTFLNNLIDTLQDVHPMIYKYFQELTRI